METNCSVRNWSMKSGRDVTASEDTYCQKGQSCCITSVLKEGETSSSSILEMGLDKNLFLAEKYKLSDANCEISVIIGSEGDKSTCSKIFANSTLRKKSETHCDNEIYVYNGTTFTKGPCDIGNSCCIGLKHTKSFDCMMTKCKTYFLNQKWREYSECCINEKKLFPTTSNFRAAMQLRAI